MSLISHCLPFIDLLPSMFMPLVHLSLLGVRKAQWSWVEWWFCHQRLIATQQDHFRSVTPRSEGRFIPREEMFASLKKRNWKVHSDLMACLFQNLIWSAQCCLWCTNQKCTYTAFRFLCLSFFFSVPECISQCGFLILGWAFSLVTTNFCPSSIHVENKR